MGSLNVFGDSVLRGAGYDSTSGRLIVNDRFGLGDVAARAGFSIRNFSKFGCTITKAWDYIQRMFQKIDCDMVLMNFGGNDCDYNWKAVSKRPGDSHAPNTSIEDFRSTYDRMLDYIKERRSLPVLATLVPVQEDVYLDHVCRTQNLDRESIRRWRDGLETDLASHQKKYSDAVVEIARSGEVPLLDIRSAFESEKDPKSLMGPDGIHPNARGQKVINGCFESFISGYLAF